MSRIEKIVLLKKVKTLQTSSPTSTILIRAPFQANGVTKGKIVRTENALSLSAPSKENKNLDTTRYARAEVSKCPVLIVVCSLDCLVTIV